MSVQLQIHGLEQLGAIMREALAKDRSLFNKASRAIGVYMIGEIQDHFDNQTLWDDSPMPQSAAAQNNIVKHEYRTSKKGNEYRAKLKKPRIEARKTLIDEHHLYKSYHQEVQGSTVLLGSDLTYAIFHDQGTKYIDPRPVLGVNPRNESDMIEEVLAVLTTGLL